MRPIWLATSLCFLAATDATAQDAVRFVETFQPNYQYRVSCRVMIDGTLKLPPGKDQAPQPLKVSGKSVVEYHERVLSAAQGRVDKTARKVHKMDFTRNVGGQDQENRLRPEVGLLVIQRLNNLEVPFSPQGPLTLGEIELVRTDVFTPALAGLLPKAPVKAGDEWPVDIDALKELTDLETIKKGGLTCRFEGIDRVNVYLARVGFNGKIVGVGEDGQAQHDLEGYYMFNLKSHHVSYLSLQGTHRPLNNDGLPQGEIKGTFVLTRDPAEIAELSDAALARVSLTPNDDNTQLLFDSPNVRFLYPRHWRVEVASGRQLRLVEKQGSDVLVTLDPVGKLPAVAQFHKEVINGLVQQKATIDRARNPQSIQSNPFSIEHFAVEARFGAQPAVFDYYVIRQNFGGATLSARYPPAQADARRREVERVAKSLALNVK